ncbi:4-hydroxythreonine-4-phosphate dehydrogenase PdxA [Candidatus Kapabacteria bacterium]|nr:4-hydroxythreonine-4-phosphate dehydrogenase PdxA [Candidatus Kapabacteria bacterium]
MKIVYSCGDTNGIGLEIFLKAIGLFPNHKHILCCNRDTMLEYFQKMFEEKPIHSSDNIFRFGNTSFTLIDCQPFNPVDFGKLSKTSGELSAKSIEVSLNCLDSKDADCFVTLPINKASIALSGWKFQGHTEMIAERYSSKDFNMLLISGDTRLAPLTIHIPLNEVASSVSSELIIKRAKSLNSTLKKDFKVNKPKIAILGLNPHSGDKGRIGNEEISIIKPAIESLKKDILVEGPFPADSFFAFKLYKSYNAIISMYHDQGLIPIKMIAESGGVNYTSGLPIVRTSPDHGTAFDIGGKNIANADSLIESIKTAILITNNRSL